MKKKQSVTLVLPVEFIEMCATHGVQPDEVLRGFIADLCHLTERPYCTNGSDERMYAQSYYDRCGYSWRNAG